MKIKQYLCIHTMRKIVDIILNNRSFVLIKVPSTIETFKLYKYSLAGHWLGDANPTGLNAWKINISNSEYNIIGKVDKILEDDVICMSLLPSNCNPLHHGYCEDSCQGGCDANRDYQAELEEILEDYKTDWILLEIIK